MSHTCLHIHHEHLMSKRMRNLAGNKRKRKNKTSRRAADAAIAMAIADASDAFVAPSPYARALRYIPQKQKVTLRYTQKVSLSSAAAATGHQVFSANGLYDPDITGSGHQPRGFDQMMELYDHYQVIGAQCKVMFESITSPSVCGIALRDTNAVTTNYLDYLEANPANTTFTMVTQQNPQHLTLKYSQKGFFGTGDLGYPYRGSAAANPGEQGFFQLFVTDIDDLASETIKALVVIDYIVVFTEPKQPSQS